MAQALINDSQWVKLGRLWFQWRSASPLPLLLLMLVLTPDFRWQGPLGPSLVLVGIFLAEGLRILAVGYAGSVTRTRGDTIPVLVHAGPFRYVRNPLYIANIALYTLLSVLFGFTYFSVVVFAYSFIQYTFIVAYEEDRLSDTFGNTYRTYQKQVHRWIPSLGPSCRSSDHSFRWLPSLRSERSTLIALGVVLLLCFWKTR